MTSSVRTASMTGVDDLRRAVGRLRDELLRAGRDPAQVSIQVDDATSVAQLKREAVRAALKTTAHAQDYVVKFRGALVQDETLTLRAIGVVPNAPFIVLPARRQPVRERPRADGWGFACQSPTAPPPNQAPHLPPPRAAAGERGRSARRLTTSELSSATTSAGSV